MQLKLTSLFSIAAGFLMGALVMEAGPDEVIFPPQDIPIQFTHDYHTRKPAEGEDGAKVDGEGLSCDFCHENVGTSTAAAERDIPSHGSCDSCHDEWIGDEAKPAAPELCAKCHTDPNVTVSTNARAKLDIPDPNLIFPHKTHVEAGVACTDCHSDVPSKTVATRDDYPTMDRCIACHEAKGAPTTCTTCHLSLPSGRLQTQFKQGELAPRRLHAFAIHDAEFLRDHSAPAKRDKAYCASCHLESFCLDCHDGVGRDVRYHPGDWLSQHFIRAKKDDYRCQSCHRVQTFCIDCHVRSGVASVTIDALVPRTPSEASRRTIRKDDSGMATGPHPMTADGWLNPASRNFHGFFAQRNIRSCASCHQEQTCITCHMSARTPFGPTLGGNPHGPNAARLKGSTASNRSARMCLKCHSPSDPNWR
jgi:hypothetical protein